MATKSRKTKKTKLVGKPGPAEYYAVHKKNNSIYIIKDGNWRETTGGNFIVNGKYTMVINKTGEIRPWAKLTGSKYTFSTKSFYILPRS
jgi:hypothetical protein